jgi:hypothetical protein
VDVKVGVGLRRRPERPVALHVGLGDRDRQIAVAAVAVERFDARQIPGAVLPVDGRRDTQQPEQRVAADLLDQYDERAAKHRRALDERAALQLVVG